MQFLIFLLFIPVFWVLILRPQQQQRRMHQSVVAGLKVGDKVMTVGGLIGTLTAVDVEVVRLDTGDHHELTLGRTFVRSLVPDASDAIDGGESADLTERADVPASTVANDGGPLSTAETPDEVAP